MDKQRGEKVKLHKILATLSASSFILGAATTGGLLDMGMLGEKVKWTSWLVPVAFFVAFVVTFYGWWKEGGQYEEME